jgi:lipoprotein-anchoring transpeptidase ErfK/SrfK
MNKKKILRRGLPGLVLFWLCLELGGYSIAILQSSRKIPNELKIFVSGKNLKELQAKNRQLASWLKSFSPRGTFILVDTAENKLYLREGTKIIREAVVSCGSGEVLEEPGGRRKWVFDTPRGEYSVQSKLIDPTWIKPDWAFIEEGEKVPKNFNDRIDEDSLGDFALGFGKGYFIHGTLYTRLLGRNVTHGCIRVGDADLKAIFKKTSFGTRIYIY